MKNQATFDINNYKKETPASKLATARREIPIIRNNLSPSSPLIDKLQLLDLVDFLTELRSYLSLFEHEMAFLETNCQSASSTKNNLKLAVRYLMIAQQAKKLSENDLKNFSDLSNAYYENIDKCYEELNDACYNIQSMIDN